MSKDFRGTKKTSVALRVVSSPVILCWVMTSWVFHCRRGLQ